MDEREVDLLVLLVDSLRKVDVEEDLVELDHALSQLCFAVSVVHQLGIHVVFNIYLLEVLPEGPVNGFQVEVWLDTLRRPVFACDGRRLLNRRIIVTDLGVCVRHRGIVKLQG